MKKLKVGDIITNAFRLGMKNFGPLIGAFLLWLLTIWIPYLNVGTTIGLIGLVVAMSKGTVFSPTEIFKADYRKYMGEFFLLLAFLSSGITMGYLFIIIPGIVISLAWGQAIYLLIDKKMGPLESIKASNKITYGEKWTIFWAELLLVLMIVAAQLLFLFATGMDDDFTVSSIVFGIIIYVLAISIMLGATAYIYSVLSKKLDG